MPETFLLGQHSDEEGGKKTCAGGMSPWQRLSRDRQQRPVLGLAGLAVLIDGVDAMVVSFGSCWAPAERTEQLEAGVEPGRVPPVVVDDSDGLLVYVNMLVSAPDIADSMVPGRMVVDTAVVQENTFLVQCRSA